MEWVVYDIETTGLRPERDEIIEIGAVLVQDGAVTKNFHCLVRPRGTVPDEVLQLTGIAAQDLANADVLEDALPGFLKFIAGKSLAAHNARFDLDFLTAACECTGYDLPVSRDSLDSLLLARVLLPFERSHRLSDVARYLGVTVDTAHRGLADAQTTAAVLNALYAQALELPLLTLQQLERIAGMFSPFTAKWFGEVAEQRMQRCGTALPTATAQTLQLVFSANLAKDSEDTKSMTAAKGGERASAATDRRKAQAEPGVVEPVFDEQPAWWFGEHSPLGQALPAFEIRPGQQQMVDAVTSALQDDTHLIAEAGTGVGKSLAYLIPAALYARKTQSRVMVATHTVALQDQIERRDFPTLRGVMQTPLSLSVFKGRTHYLCMRKLAQENAGADFGTPQPELEAYMTLLRWVASTPAGNREELAFSGKMPEVWQRVQSETETCIHKRCPFFHDCYYFRARSEAYDADIVVTNHSLVLSDLKADHRVLPRYEKIIFDEAHHLEEAATRHLGSEVYAGQCALSISRLVRDGGKHGIVPELVNRLTEAGTPGHAVFTVLETLLQRLHEVKLDVDEAFLTLSKLVPPGQSEYRITGQVTADPLWKAYLSLTQRLLDVQTQLSEQADALEEIADREGDPDLSGRIFDAAGFVRELSGRLDTLCQAGSAGSQWVVWVERTGPSERPHVSVHVAPIDVAGILRSTLFDTKETVVLTSATLSVDGRFDYIRERLGLDEACERTVHAVSVESPFDYRQQALLCVPNDVPELARMGPTEAAVWVADSIYQLTRVSGGRLLALFTSHAMLRAVAKALRDPLQSLGQCVYAQGVDGNRAHLLEAFRAGEGGVLLGAQSFWEGIDLPGDQLTTLVIVRLPFSPPTHPVTAARHERLEAQGKSAFWHASLPEAVVRFRQGFGRLIRTTSDRGVVVVYDKRIITARYGQAFVRALTGVRPFVETEQAVIQRVQSFLESAPDVHNASACAHNK